MLLKNKAMSSKIHLFFKNLSASQVGNRFWARPFVKTGVEGNAWCDSSLRSAWWYPSKAVLLSGELRKSGHSLSLNFVVIQRLSSPVLDGKNCFLLTAAAPYGGQM